MSKCIDLTGQRFGRLTVVGRADNYITPKGAKFSRWNCICDCGKKTIVVSSSLRSGNTTSCGCYHDQCCRERRIKHGKSGGKLNWVWTAMKERCLNPNSKDYKYYGARGITVCDDWENSFESFMDWAYSNGYQEGLSIDRINVDGDYCPDNCRWADAKMQANNTTRNRKITYNGETHTVSEWSEITGIKYRTILQRANMGWNAERILMEPAKRGKNQWS